MGDAFRDARSAPADPRPPVGSGNAMREHLLLFVAVLASAALAIVAHAALPAKVDESLLDGILVRRAGFAAVAAAYFILLFAHVAAVIGVNRINLRRGSARSGVLLGSAFALLYMVGMQEIMLDATPFAVWGLEFVAYQFLMGLGDAVPVLILSVAVAALVGRPRRDGEVARVDAAATVLRFALIVGSIRMLSSLGGTVESRVAEYPVPVIAWGVTLGAAFGAARVLLDRACVTSRAVMFYGVGLNWIIFNMFIGVVKDGAMADALTRSVLDCVAIAAADSCGWSRGWPRGLPSPTAAGRRLRRKAPPKASASSRLTRRLPAR